jgi:hypothetical protein
MSLPIVWWSSAKAPVKWVAIPLWCAIVMTLSEGALAAVLIVSLAAALTCRTRWKSTVLFLALGATAYGVLLPIQMSVPKESAAAYTTEWNSLRQRPGVRDRIPLEVQNVGDTTWRAEGSQRAAIAYRWWRPDTESFLKVAPIITPLPRDVVPGETIKVPVEIETPEEPGDYILVIELFDEELSWFSEKGVIPLLIQTDLEPLTTRSVDSIDLSAIYQRKANPDALTMAVPRLDLWKAALRMFVAHPLGVGPDNFRLEYGKYLGASSWDTSL